MSGDCVRQLEYRQILAEEQIGASRQTGFTHFRAVVGRVDCNAGGRLRPIGPNAAANLDPVHVGHHHVKQDNIWHVDGDAVERLLAAGHPTNLPIIALENDLIKIR